MIWVLAHLALLLKLGFWGQFLGGQTWLYDFDNYYRLAGDILRGVNPYSVSYMQTPGPILVILPFVPFTLLPLQTARIAMTGISIAAGYATCGLLAARFWPKRKPKAFFILATILFSAFSTRFNFITGQSGLIIMLGLTVFLVSKNKWQRGIALAAVIIFKTYLAGAVLGLLRKNIKIAIITGLILAGVSLATIGVYGYISENIREVFTSTGGSADLDYYSQTMRASFHRLRLDDIYLPVYMASAAGLLVLAAVTGSWEIGVVVSLILSPVVWQHYMVILFPIFVELWARWAVSPKKKLTLLIIGLWMWAEFKFVHGKPVLFPWTILASQYFLGEIAVLLILLMDRGGQKRYKDKLLL
jgi:hypothetical protein